MTSSLIVDGVSAWYGEFRALSDVSLAVQAGTAHALIGANGAGKSTLLRLLCGLVPRWTGRVEIGGRPLPPGNPEAASALGLALVPEGRLLFDSLTVEENLLIGQTGRPGPWTLAALHDLFPILRDKRRNYPAQLSGGQQQMVAIARALASNPAILLCDEISLGLAPAVVREVYAALDRVRAEGVTVVLVDQDIERACRDAAAVTCLMKGRVTHAGPARGVTPATLREAYFGVRA